VTARNAGRRFQVTVIPFGNFKQKMRRANHLALDYVILYGEDEAKHNQFALKNMETGTQELLDFSALKKKLRVHDD